MDRNKKNYKSDNEIQKELANVNIDNFLDCDYNGKYEFVRCAHCEGPLLGHLEVKCPRLEYDGGTAKKFETHLKGLEGFRTALKQREMEKEELKMKAMKNMVKMTVEGLQNRGNAQGITQIVKSKQPPLWSGQQFDRWRLKVER